MKLEETTDFISKCSKHTFMSLFPRNVKNWKTVYFINIIHIIGVLYIHFGLLSKPEYLKYYICYLLFLMITYILMNNRCFMTILSNYFSEKNYNMLCIKLKDAKNILFVYLALAILFYIYPQYSAYTTIVKIFNRVFKK